MRAEIRGYAHFSVTRESPGVRLRWMQVEGLVQPGIQDRFVALPKQLAAAAEAGSFGNGAHPESNMAIGLALDLTRA